MSLRIHCVAALLALALLGACGGDGGDSASPPAAEPKAGTFVGTITGFGSVIVNGIRFDDSGAVVTINDQPGTVAQLKVGMVVTIEGSVHACPNPDVVLCTGVASRIRFRNNLDGPITAVNRLTNTIQVMGRLVELDDTTIVEGGTAADISGLAIGDVVWISGLEEQDRIRARLVERTSTYVPGTTPMQVYGTVSNVNAAQGTCTVDGVPVGFQALAPANLPPGGLANGQYVEVTGTGNGNGLVTADRIQDRDRISYPDATLVEIEGYVTSFVSVSDFVVAGQRVDASDAMFVNGTAADLKDGVKVEVEGTMSGALLIARKVIFRLEANAKTMNVQIVAPIQSKAPATMSLTVLGKTVKTTPLTQFIDRVSSAAGPVRMAIAVGAGGSDSAGGSAGAGGSTTAGGSDNSGGAGGPTDSGGSAGAGGTAGAGGSNGAGGPPSPLAYADLQVGDRVDVMAYQDASGALVATRVERTNPDVVLIARGPVDTKVPLIRLTLFGIDVTTGANTRYRDIDSNLITDAAFYALVQVPPAVPSVVRAQGIASAASGSTIDATRTADTRGEVEIAK